MMNLRDFFSRAKDDKFSVKVCDEHGYFTHYEGECLKCKMVIYCDKHGKQQALINKTCIKCFSEKKEQEFKIVKNDIELTHLKIQANISKLYLNSTFDNYDVEKVGTPQLQQKCTKFLEFCKQFSFEQNLIFLGNPGTGKTHIASALIEKALLANKTAYYVPFYRLIDIKINNRDLYNQLLHKDFIVLDEFGASKSDFNSTLFFEFINERYMNESKTLIISNLDIDELKKAIGDTAFSRIKENVTLKICTWNDYRLIKKEGEK